MIQEGGEVGREHFLLNQEEPVNKQPDEHRRALWGLTVCPCAWQALWGELHSTSFVTLCNSSVMEVMLLPPSVDGEAETQRNCPTC